MSKFFCPLPWIHQFIQADGIKMCCSSKTKLSVTPEEFAESDHLNSVKQTIINGDIPKDCMSCANLERKGFTSTRTSALKDWSFTIDTVPDKLLYLDLRYSNLCNFSCRSCEPAFSSSISEEIISNPILKKYYNAPTQIHVKNQLSESFFTSTLPTIKRINFTGGEPLLIKDNISVLEKLLEFDNKNCEILITTNGSVMNDKILRLINQFTNVHWTISLDGIEKSAEYIRYGTNWSQLKKNINSILNLRQSVAFNTVLSSYSVLSLSRLVNFFKEIKLRYSDQPVELWVSLCEFPDFLSPKILPNTLREIARLEIDRSITELLLIETNPKSTTDNLISLRKNLNDSIIKTSLYDKFVDFTENLDKIRDQKFERVYGVKL